VVLWDEGSAAVYGFPDLALVVFCWVGCGSMEVIVVVYELLYLCVVLLSGQNDQGISVCRQKRWWRRYL
jgi:hypothetical protein